MIVVENVKMDIICIWTSEKTSAIIGDGHLRLFVLSHIAGAIWNATLTFARGYLQHRRACAVF